MKWDRRRKSRSLTLTEVKSQKVGNVLVRVVQGVFCGRERSTVKEESPDSGSRNSEKEGQRLKIIMVGEGKQGSRELPTKDVNERVL